MTGETEKSFSLRLGKLLVKKKMTQKELSDKISENTSKISQCASGKRLPDTEMLLKLASFFHVSTDFLLGRSETSSNNATVQSAVNYTGLSEKALCNIRHLQKRPDGQESFKALDFLLRTDNQEKLYVLLKNISDCRNCVSINKQDAIEQQKKEDRYNAEAEKDGVVYLSPDKAAKYYAHMAAHYLTDLCLQGLSDGKDGEP